MSTVKFWEDVKYRWFQILGRGALLGLFLLVTAYFIKVDEISSTVFVFGILALVPWAVHLNLIVIWHWKARYKGSHSKLWGALLFIETSGFCKLIYWLMHVLPDRNGEGPYYRVPNEVET